MDDARSIEAYEIPRRIASYDADMDVMHPLRSWMIELALQVLPFPEDAQLRALDLGVGTGLFTRDFLDMFTEATVVAVDGAEAMLALARSRLGALAGRAEFHQADFRRLPDELVAPDSYDVVLSSYALHHLDAREKRSVVGTCVGALKTGGWFLNADLVVAASTEVEGRFQDLRVAGVVARAAPGDERFATGATTRAFLDEMEAAEGDQPQTLDVDLSIFRSAGLPGAEILWKQYREAVIGGPKPAGVPVSS